LKGILISLAEKLCHFPQIFLEFEMLKLNEFVKCENQHPISATFNFEKSLTRYPEDFLFYESDENLETADKETNEK